MEHSPSTPQRHVRFHVQDKENAVHPLPTKTCDDDKVNTATPHSTPVPQKAPSSASKRLRHHFQQQCSVTDSKVGLVLEQTLLVDSAEGRSNSDSNNKTRALLSQQHKESTNATVVRRDQDPVASTLLQDDADMDMDVVVMSGDLKDWPGLIRPVATKFYPM